MYVSSSRINSFVVLDNVILNYVRTNGILRLTYVRLFNKIIYIKYLKVFYTNLVFEKTHSGYKMYRFGPVYIMENLIDVDDTFIITQFDDRLDILRVHVRVIFLRLTRVYPAYLFKINLICERYSLILR